MDLLRRSMLKGSLKTTAQKPLGSVLPQIRPMNPILKRAYGYAEETGVAFGENRRETPAMTVASDGVFIAGCSILPLLLLGAISSTARTLQAGWNDLETLFPITGERS
jgi:hypothetical protein